MKIAASIPILVLSWVVLVAQAEIDTEAYMSVVSDYMEEEDTSSAEEWTPRYPWEPSPGAEDPTAEDLATERDTYRDVCTGYVEGGGDIVQTTTCPDYSSCCFGGGFVTCTLSEAECYYSPEATAPSEHSESKDESKSSPLSTGGIIGIAVSAGCSVLGLIFTVAFKIWKHRRKEKGMQNEQGYN